MELYLAAAPESERAKRMLSIEQKRKPFLDDCTKRLADGKFTIAHLDCAANAASLEAGNACFPPRE